MSDFDTYAEGLADEVLSEMAENFFGSRRDMDSRIEQFKELVIELKPFFKKALAHVEALHFVLLDQEGRDGLYRLLGADPLDLPAALGDAAPPQLERMPFAFSVKSRFRKVVERVYRDTRFHVHAYLHGREYSDPEEPRRKRLSVHYVGLKRLERQINTAMKRLNGQTSLSGTLQYIRGLNPAELEREKVAGMPAGNVTKLDEQFRFKPVDLESEGLVPLPDFPPFEEVRGILFGYIDALYARDKAAVRKMLGRLRRELRDVREPD
jgi:hypothetical protein